MTGITVDVLDRIHRLLRLSRHVPWDLWELDLLVRTTHLGGGAVNGPALVALRDAAQLQGRLNVPAETLATWFGDLPRQGRPDPADPARAAMSAYAALFANPAVLNPPDPAFATPGGGAITADHHPALLAALSVTESELTALLAKVGATFDIAHLSGLVRWATLARGLGMRAGELLALATLVESVVEDPFASPRRCWNSSTSATSSTPPESRPPNSTRCCTPGRTRRICPATTPPPTPRAPCGKACAPPPRIPAPGRPSATSPPPSGCQPSTPRCCWPELR